eukprot:TRINITY_DN19322_c0_g1_i1.p1 TRINITY_DN19322_c0_g1~~TRINITY_DN19322_c0_g1_i1.p1  ORF type:complete len:166 (-),score=38.46 TRINITY_DN19322_c0_g1_i1:72-569(-)
MASAAAAAQSAAGAAGAPGKRLVNDVCVDMLLLEASSYLLGRRGKPGEAEDLEAENFREVHHSAIARLESLGWDVGCRLTERLCQTKLLSGEPLEAVKFICKDFWTEVFRKQIDKLQTDHRGTFVLRELNFKWLAKYAPPPSPRSICDCPATELLIGRLSTWSRC